MSFRPGKTIATTLIVVAGTLAGPASAEVYRCDDGDAIVFSDVPCSETAELYETRVGISVVNAADDLGEVAERNRAFVDRRQEELAANRARAAERRRQAERFAQRRAAAEQPLRYRTIIGQLANPRSTAGRPTRSDPRIDAQQQRRAAEDELERRRTLLSRSGGNQPRILR